jgi:hypothetical protein
LVSAFVIGAGIGSIVTLKLIKPKYEQYAEDKIAEMRDFYLKKMDTDEDEKQEESSESTNEKEEERPVVEEPSNKVNYNEIVKNLGYADNDTDAKGGEVVVKKNKPYVIPPEEFGEIDEYDTESLTYYQDGVLADSDDMIIEDVEDMVGEDSLTHFGEYEDDSVFVRNDAHRCDYEILRDLRRYSEAKRP